jgi:hypothetical protein
MTHDNISDDTTTNAEAAADFIPTFADSMRIIPCPEVTVVDVEDTLTRIWLVSPQNVV